MQMSGCYAYFILLELYSKVFIIIILQKAAYTVLNAPFLAPVVQNVLHNTPHTQTDTPSVLALKHHILR